VSVNRIPDTYLKDLLNRIDIVEYISRSVTLKKGGANYFACCPFHSEKSGSFTVSPAKQFYHCFGCGAHGTAISFAMENTGGEFREVIASLATEYGMPPLDNAMVKQDEALQAVGARLYDAAQFYERKLYESEDARAYLRRRGLGQATAKRYQIGFAPAGWNALTEAFPKYATDDALIKAGLVTENDEKRRYDRFRERIMFPIHGTSGRVIAFGGRVIVDGRENDAKYLNSAEIVGFEKGKELYGMYQARLGIRELGYAFCVEGYMDVVMLAQHGVNNAVATLGTACTPHHVSKLLKICDAVYFSFDGDAAGRKAAWRAAENCLDQAVDNKLLAFIFLPDGEDPDSYVATNGAEAFHALRNDSIPLSRFLVQKLEADVLEAGFSLATAEAGAKLLADAKPYLQKMNQAPALRVGVVKLLCERTGLTMAEAERILGMRFGGDGKRPVVPRKQAAPASIVRRILELLVAFPQEAGRLNHEWVGHESREDDALMAMIAIANALNGDEQPSWIANLLSQSEYADVYSASYGAAEEFPMEFEEWQVVFGDALVQMEVLWSEGRMRELTQMDKEGKLDRNGRIEFMNLTTRIHQLRKSLVRDDAAP
jgi:DNA primase